LSVKVTDFDEIFKEVQRGPRNNRLDFGGDWDHRQDPGFLGDNDSDPGIFNPLPHGDANRHTIFKKKKIIINQ